MPLWTWLLRKPEGSRLHRTLQWKPTGVWARLPHLRSSSSINRWVLGRMRPRTLSRKGSRGSCSSGHLVERSRVHSGRMQEERKGSFFHGGYSRGRKRITQESASCLLPTGPVPERSQRIAQRTWRALLLFGQGRLHWTRFLRGSHQEAWCSMGPRHFFDLGL